MRERLLSSVQEAVREKIELVFGVKQFKWNRLCRPSKFMSVDSMEDIMTYAINMHNMCVE